MGVLLTVVGIVLLNVYVNGQFTNVNKCDDVDGSVLPEVKVLAGLNSTLCIDQPCVVVPGRDLSMDINFKSPRYLENIKPNIRASTIGVTMDYPLLQEDACEGIINTYCPIVKDEKVEYFHTITLLTIFPEVTVNLEFTINNKDDDTAVICFSLDIKVVKM